MIKAELAGSLFAFSAYLDRLKNILSSFGFLYCPVLQPLCVAEEISVWVSFFGVSARSAKLHPFMSAEDLAAVVTD